MSYYSRNTVYRLYVNEKMAMTVGASFPHPEASRLSDSNAVTFSFSLENS